MKHIKKSLLLTMAMCVALGLAACGGTKDDSSSSSIGGENNSSSVIGDNSSEIGGGTSNSESGDNSGESGGVQLPDSSVEIPETEGAPVANQAEWDKIIADTLASTNATIITTVSEDGVLMEDGIVMISGGITYERWNNMDGTEDYYFYGEVDGQSYYFWSNDAVAWTVEETDRSTEDYATVAYELEGLADELPFEMAVWDAETSMYTWDFGSEKYSMKISDGKVVRLAGYMNNAMMPGVDFVYEIVYGKTPVLTLPEMPKDDDFEMPELPEMPYYDGDVVSQEQWDEAWANTNNATNLTAVFVDVYMDEGKMETVYGVGYIADGKYYSYTYHRGDYEYVYFGKVDGRYYQWTSVDNETWFVDEIFGDLEYMTTGAILVRGLDQSLDFSKAKYEDGYYKCATEWANVEIKISGGYVVEIWVFSEEDEMSYQISYGDAYVGELPPLDDVVIGEEIKDASEWAKAIAETNEQANFIYTATGRMDREDGKISVMTEYCETDNGKVYLERSNSVHSGSGSASGIGIAYYQGVVDGKAYQWDRVGDDLWVSREISEVEDYTIVEFLGLDDLDFAAAEFDAKTGAYIFNADGAKIAVRIVDDLVVYVELTTGGMYVEYSLTYGNAIVELPALNNEGGEGGEDFEDPSQPEKPSKPNPDIVLDQTLGDNIIGQEVSTETLQLAILNTYESTNFTVYGYATETHDGEMVYSFGFTHMANGKAYNSTTIKGAYNDAFELYIGTVDGTEYVWVSMGNDLWQWTPAEMVDMAGMTNGSVFAMYLGYFDCETAIFNPKTGAYSFFMEEDEITIEVKIVNDRVASFTLSGDGLCQKYVVEYDKADVGELPPLSSGDDNGNEKPKPNDPSNPNPDVNVNYSDIEFTLDMNVGQGIIGEQVSSDVLLGAIEKALASTNFTMQGKSYIQGGASLLASNVANGKMYSITQATYPVDGKYETTTMHMITGMVNGVNWAWTSFDGMHFENYPADEVVVGGGASGEEMFGTYLRVFQMGAYMFNANTGEYYMGGEGDILSIKIVDGEVRTIYIASGEMYMLYVINYGNAVDFRLPPLMGDVNFDSEKVSQAEWDKAFEMLFASDNVTMKTIIESDTLEYGKVWEGAEYLLNGASIEYKLDRKTENGLDDTRQRMVFAYENGVEVQYNYSHDTGIWTKAKNAALTTEELWDMGTRSLTKFADLYAEMDAISGGYLYLNEYTFSDIYGNQSTFYEIRININGGRVIEISYQTKEGAEMSQTTIFFYDYDCTMVRIPVDGQGDPVDNEFGDVIQGGESNDKENGYDNVVDNGYGNVVNNNNVNFN